MNYASIAVLGAGSWGTALSLLLHRKGHRVKLWTRSIQQCQEITASRENAKYLPGIYIPETLEIDTDIEKVVTGANLILFVVPSQSVRSVIKLAAPYLKPHQIIVNAAKGLEQNTHLRISQVVKEELPEHSFAVLSGPSHAEEVCRDLPTTVVVASYSRKVAETVQEIFITPNFRVYTNPDVAGVELGGALKNVIAFGAGICDGLGFGDNAKAALITRGITEIARLGKAIGGNIATFAGLSGIGDLIVTCTSMHSRNRRAGILIGQGKSLEETLKEVGMVVEGIITTKVAYELSCKYQIEMPITKEIYHILYCNSNAKDAVTNLMTRSRTHEIEEIANAPNIGW